MQLSITSYRYKFSANFNSKATVIMGDSGTGKTALVNNILSEGVECLVESDYDICVLTDKTWKTILRRMNQDFERHKEKYEDIQCSTEFDTYCNKVSRYFKSLDPYVIDNSIIFIDDKDLVDDIEFKIMFDLDKSNYYVFIMRKDNIRINIGPKDYYEMKNDKEVHWLEHFYKASTEVITNVDRVIVEGNGSDYLFFKNQIGSKVVTPKLLGCKADGKDQILNAIDTIECEENIVIFVDMASFGFYLTELLYKKKNRTGKTHIIWDYDSFEYFLLRTNMYMDNNLDKFVEDNCVIYNSKERLYTERLIQLSKGEKWEYRKDAKSPVKCLVQDCCWDSSKTNCKMYNKLRGNKLCALVENTEFSFISALCKNSKENYEQAANNLIYTATKKIMDI